LSNGTIVQVASFVETGEKIEIDTRTGEFRKRA
jgi:elongation factor P